MKIIFTVVIAALVSGCEAQAGSTEMGGRYSAFEVREYGLVCVAGGSGQLSCVKK